MRTPSERVPPIAKLPRWKGHPVRPHLNDDEAEAKMRQRKTTSQKHDHGDRFCFAYFFAQQASAAAVGERSAKTFCAAMRPLPKAKAGEGNDFAMTCSSAPMSAMASM